MKGHLELTLVALPGVFYNIRWNYYFYLPFEIIPKNSFEQTFVVLKEKPYAFSLASNKLWLSVSNALDRSINIVPTSFPFINSVFALKSISVLYQYSHLFQEVNGCPLSFLAHCRGYSLTNPMLLTAFYFHVWPNGTQNPCNQAVVFLPRDSKFNDLN